MRSAYNANVPCMLNASTSLNPGRRATIAAHAAFVPCGLVTVLLGPLLPVLASRWKLNDTQSGDLFFAQFLASSVGVLLSGAVVTRRGYRLAILAGLGFMALGLGILPLLEWPAGLAAVSAWGVGFGITIPACNLLVAALHSEHQASALNLLNFSWSVGAVACPFLLAPFARSQRVDLFLLLACGTIVALMLALTFVVFPYPAAAVSSDLDRGGIRRLLLSRTAFVLGCLFFLYTGVENAAGGWIASYAKRSGSSADTLWVTTPSFFYLFLLIGRALAPVALRRLRDENVAQLGLAVSSVGIVALLLSSSMAGILVSAAAIGLGLAPVYPITISRMARSAGPRSPQVGSVMFALAGLGASVLPWLVGFTSTQFGSLKLGLLAILIGSALMLGLYLVPQLDWTDSLRAASDAEGQRETP